MLRVEAEPGLAMWRKMVEVHRSVRAQAQKENLATPTRAVSFNLFFTLIGFSLRFSLFQRLETALPYLALLRDLPVFSPSTSWESPTPAAPQSMETPHLGAPPRLMPTTTMSLVPGDTVMPPALFKVEK